MDARVERVETAGVSCHTWLVGDDDEVIVVDPGRDAAGVLAAVGDREVLAVICTHGHPAHAAAAIDVATRDDAPVAVHQRDLMAWRDTHPGDEPDIEMEEGGVFEVSDVELEVLHTPGHTPGSVSLYCEGLGVVLTGDALLAAGPAPHEGEYPDFALQIGSIGEELLTLPGGTRVLPGHGEQTTIAAAERRFDDWIAAGPALADRPD